MDYIISRDTLGHLELRSQSQSMRAILQRRRFQYLVGIKESRNDVYGLLVAMDDNLNNTLNYRLLALVIPHERIIGGH